MADLSQQTALVQIIAMISTNKFEQDAVGSKTSSGKKLGKMQYSQGSCAAILPP
jgi:hypothetical protein